MHRTCGFTTHACVYWLHFFSICHQFWLPMSNDFPFLLHVYVSRLIIWPFCRSVNKSCLSLWPHGLQHTRLSCPSPSSGACSNSSPLNWWCHPAISSSVAPFSSCLQSFPATGSFPVSGLFISGGQNIGAFALIPHLCMLLISSSFVAVHFSFFCLFSFILMSYFFNHQDYFQLIYCFSIGIINVTNQI